MSSLAFLSHGVAILPKSTFPNVGLKHPSAGHFSQRVFRTGYVRATPTCVTTDSKTESKTDFAVNILENPITTENMKLVISKAADIVDADMSDIPSRRVFYSGVALWLTIAMVTLTVSSTVVAYIDRLPLIPDALRLIGFSYSCFFVWKYLVLEDSREELVSKISENIERIKC